MLSGTRIVQLGPGLAAAVCGRLYADLGAEVITALGAPAPGVPGYLLDYLNHGKTSLSPDPAPALARTISNADLVLCEGHPSCLRARGHDPGTLRNQTAAVLCYISPFGLSGPHADRPATDLTLLCASGIARLLTGQVADTTEPPVRAVGEQAAFIGGLAAACASTHALLGRRRGLDPAIIDVSQQEALATIAIQELTRAGLGGQPKSRRRTGDGNGATVCILPARDGYVAISPREEHQWQSWLGVMGMPAWGDDPRLATKRGRIDGWDEVHSLMSAWSRSRCKQAIADAAQAAHVPSFPLRTPAEQLTSEQLTHRRFYRPEKLGGHPFKVPNPPFAGRVGVPSTASGAASGTAAGAVAEAGRPPSSARKLPLDGVRVLDFSWVIAGPTATRHLAAMGAEVLKVEAPGRGDPGRATELHTALGQGKEAITLNLKTPAGVETARALAEHSDVVVENFATGVMERLGLGEPTLRAGNPSLVYVSASGLGRTGPEAGAVAYGTLLQCYAGFAGLNGYPDRAPRVGMAWLDPMCGLMLAFATAAALAHRERTGEGRWIDFSMVEAMLWTMAEPLLGAQLGQAMEPRGNASEHAFPHGVYQATGDDRWVGIACTTQTEWKALCGVVPSLRPLQGLNFAERRHRAGAIDEAIRTWVAGQSPRDVECLLERAVPCAQVVSAVELAADAHLEARGFWTHTQAGRLPGLPWQSTLGRHIGPAPGLGEHTRTALQRVLGFDQARLDALAAAGVFGRIPGRETAQGDTFGPARPACASSQRRCQPS